MYKTQTIIKTIKKIIGIIILVIISLPITLLLLINSPKVQTEIIKYISSVVKKDYNVDIQIEQVEFSFFDKLTLKNTLILDHKKDTLIYAKLLTTSLKKLNLKNNKIKLGRTTLNNGLLRIYRYPDESMNIKEFVKAFKSDSVSTKPYLKLDISKIELFDTKFVYQRFNREKKEYGMNYRDIIVDDINAVIENFNVRGDTVNFYSTILQGKEQCGMILDDFSGQVSLHDHFTTITKGKLRTPKSFVVVNSLRFDYKDYLDYIEFVDNVTFNVDLEYSNINLKSFSYFSPSLRENDFRVLVQGKLKGKIKNLKGKDIIFKLGKYTELKSNFTIKGLPDYKNSFYLLDIANLNTTAVDFKNAFEELLKNKNKKLSPEVENLGLLNFKGNITGFYDDIVAYGNLVTNIGDIHVDLSLKNKDKIYFSGEVRTDKFNVGKLTDIYPTVSNISFNTKIAGQIVNKDYQIKTESTISHFEINNYNYRNITINGDLWNDNFSGIVFCNDPNLNFSFLGDLNYSKDNPSFIFNTKLNKANLNKLNFWVNDSIANISLDIESNFTGNKFENLNGEIEILNTNITVRDKKYKLQKIKIFTENTTNRKDIQLNSSILNAKIGGDFTQNTLIKSITNIYESYFPSLTKSTSESIFKTDSTSTLDFSADIYNINDLLSTINSKIRVDSNTRVSVNLDFKRNKLSLQGNSKYFQYDKQLIRDVDLSISNVDSIMNLTLKAKSLNYGPEFIISNPNINCNLLPDNILINIGWNNFDSLNYSGNIKANIKSFRDSLGDFNSKISLLPSKITIKNKEWETTESQITIKQDYMNWSFFSLFNNNEKATIDGQISRNTSDTLLIRLTNFNVSDFNIYTEKFGIKLGGLFNGEAKISDIYNQPMILSNFKALNVTFNDSLIGNATLTSNWDNINKNAHFEIQTHHDNFSPLKLSGIYTPQTNEIVTNCILKNIRLNLFNNLWKDKISVERGLFSANIDISGNIQDPLINGKLRFHKTKFKVNYTNTNYLIEDSLQIINNNIKLNDFKIADQNSNFAHINGTITNQNLKDFEVNTTISYNNFLSLNTENSYNNSFFGKVVLSGNIKVKGKTNDLTLSIQTTTEKGTEIYIPLANSSNISQNKLINFTTKKETEAIYIPEEWKETISKLNMNLHLDLKITPEAKAQLVIDSKIGDVINGQGSGDIQVEMIKDKPVKVFGEYVFEKGDYMFTFQNVINKKFSIESGSNIILTGDAKKARIDLNAIYSTKSSLSQIFPEDSARYSRRIPVDCSINMRGNLTSPEIMFDINLPSADAETKSRLENLINTEEKRNKQFISLLVINSFYPETNSIGYSSTSSQLGSSSLNTTASELLSNQLSLWLSQLSKDFDIGVNYRPGNEISKDEVVVALSTQLLNGAVTFNGNVDYGGNKQNNQAIAGEFNLEVKANKTGSVRFKGFNRSNDQMIYQTSQYTQGIGITYTEEFNTFGELWRKYKMHFVNLFTSKDKKNQNLNIQKDSIDVKKNKTGN